mgnify:CR=1 FL=1
MRLYIGEGGVSEVVVVIAGPVAAQHFHLLVSQTDLTQSDYYH